MNCTLPNERKETDKIEFDDNELDKMFWILNFFQKLLIKVVKHNDLPNYCSSETEVIDAILSANNLMHKTANIRSDKFNASLVDKDGNDGNCVNN